VERDIRSLRKSVVVLTTLALFVVFYFARDLLLPVLLGFLIALTLSPVNRALLRVGLPAGVSATVLILIASAVASGILYFMGETVSARTADIPEIMRELRQKFSNLSYTLERVKDASDEVEALASGAEDTAQQVVVEQPGLLTSAVTVAASTITSAIVALVLAWFLLASGDMFYTKLVRVFDKMSDKKRALSTAYDIERQVSRYLLTITLINAGLGVSVALAMWAVGLDNAYVWGIAAFVLNFLPVLGGLIGTGLVAMYAITFFDSFSYALVAPLIYQFLTTFEAQFVTPHLLGRRLELNTVAVFLTVVLWGWLWGIAGVLVAVPFLLVFKVVCDRVEGLHTIASFLGAAENEAKKAPAA